MTEDEARASALLLVPSCPEPIALSDLESHLGKAADLLRGAIDQADFKAFIFPLMFFKRISDVYLEEYGLALADSGGDHEFAAFAENHRFQIPQGCLWGDVRARTENIGQALVTAFREIEKANPDSLYGIFGNAPWTNKQKLTDSTLADLIEHFSAKPLTNSCVSPDVFGQAYEYLIKRFADQSNKKAGEYYTPRSVVKLLVNILDPQEGETVYDPACGTGGMLIEVIEHVKTAGGQPQLLWGKLFGQEKVLTTSGIARMNMLLHGVEDFKIVKDDTLQSPAFFAKDKLATFDCVIANPPFSLQSWGSEAWSSDPYKRNALGGTPPDKNGDWAWVQHMVSSMAPTTGRVAVVLPQAAMSRTGVEALIRRSFVEADLVEAVIALAPNLFYGTTIAANVMVFRSTKGSGRRGKILMVDGEALFQKGRNQNTLDADHVDLLANAYRSFTDIDSVSKVVSLAEVMANDYNLSVPLYISRKPRGTRMEVGPAVADLVDAHARTRTARDEVTSHLAEWGLS